MAVERVEQLLRKMNKALNDAGFDYAIIGGNAVIVCSRTSGVKAS